MSLEADITGVSADGIVEDNADRSAVPTAADPGDDAEEIEEIKEEVDDDEDDTDDVDTYTFSDADGDGEDDSEGKEKTGGAGSNQKTERAGGGLKDSSPFDPRMGHGMGKAQYEDYLRKEREADEMESAMETIDESTTFNQIPTEYPEDHVRLGDVDGHDDPLAAEWRIEAESVITSAAESVGAVLKGITWSMARVTVTVANTEEVVPLPFEDDTEDWKDVDKHVYSEDAPTVGTLGAAPVSDASAQAEIEPVNLGGITTVARAVIQALEDIVDHNNVIERVHVEVTTPGAPDELTTQRQFDAFKGFDVRVETEDPWKSNRVIEGKIIERGPLDLKINVKGRIVKIPVAMVGSVRLPKAKKEKF